MSGKRVAKLHLTTRVVHGLLVDALLVQGFSVAPCIAFMFPIGARKSVITTEVFPGAHKNEVVLIGVEHSIEITRFWKIDGARGQTRMLISVVGAVNFSVHVEHASN